MLFIVHSVNYACYIESVKSSHNFSGFHPIPLHQFIICSTCNEKAEMAYILDPSQALTKLAQSYFFKANILTLVQNNQDRDEVKHVFHIWHRFLISLLCFISSLMKESTICCDISINHICDTINGNKSHVGNFQFWFFNIKYVFI